MKKLILLLLFIPLVFSCSSSESTDEIIDNEEPSLKYPAGMLNSYSDINKNTSWYKTNISFDKLFNLKNSNYWGFEKLDNGSYKPFVQGSYNSNKVDCCYYWNDLGGYLYTDMNNDGSKDLWAYYLKAPWPTNMNGLHLYVDNANGDEYDLQIGLTQVRKQVLSDFNNDGVNEIMLFSSGFDADPFPGDSLAFFNAQNKKYSYLTDDIGYFHGGATGDVDLDGYQDIVAYSGGSAVIPVHPVFYKNLGSLNFNLNNEIFVNFSDNDNYYTVELFDINEDGFLDLFLGTTGALIIIKNENGIFDRNKGINIQTDQNLEVMDIDFFDFNDDGINDILVMNNKNGYNGYSLNLYRFSFETNGEITSNYFDITEHSGSNSWVKWLHIFDSDNDGDLDIIGDGLFGDLVDKQVLWRNENGKFKRYQY